MSKMKKSTKVRIVLIFLIILIDILILPWILKFPVILVSNLASEPESLATAPSRWIEYGLLNSIKAIFTDPPFRNLFLFMQIGVMALIVAIAWNVNGLKKRNRIHDGVGGPEPAGAGQHGTSRWQNLKEMDEFVSVWHSDKPLKRGGTILGVEVDRKGREKVWLNSKDMHTLLIALTRFGKGRRIFLPSIWSLAKSGESIVATDPKGELFIITKDYLKEQGYDVVCLNFRDPNMGNQWNLMELVNRAVDEGDFPKATEIARDIANTIAPKNAGGQSDPIWGNGERAVITSLILIVAMNAQFKFQRHMKSVYRLLARYGRVLPDDSVPLLDYIANLPDDHPAKDAFATADLAPHKMRGSFFSMVLSDLQLFSDPNIGEMTAKSDHELRNVGLKKTAVFLIIPDDKPDRNVLATIYIDQLYQSLVKLANEEGGRIPNRTNVLLDEFGNLPAISDFDSKVTVAGGRGIRFTIAVQALKQITKLYKDNADTITGNCAIWIYFGTNDPHTSKILSEKTGKYTVETENSSSSVQNRGHSSTAGVGLTGRSLLTSDEIERWNNEETLVFQVSKFPARYPVLDLSMWQANIDFGLAPRTNDIVSDENENRLILKDRWSKVISRPTESVSVWLPDIDGEDDDRQEEIPRQVQRKAKSPDDEMSFVSENNETDDVEASVADDYSLDDILKTTSSSNVDVEEDDFL